MFAESQSRIHETYCLQRADVAFFRGNVQLTAAPWVSADRVEVRFRGSKGDQMRTGGVLTRVRGGGAEAFGCRWRRCRSHDRVDVLLSVSSVVCPPGCVRYGQRQMVYVDAAASNDIVACSGCVGGRACERVRFALPEDWGRNSLVGGGGFTRGVAA